MILEGESRRAQPAMIQIVAVLVTVALTLYGYSARLDSTHHQESARFELLVQEGTTAFLRRVSSYEQVLRGAAGFLAGSDHVSRSEWASYVQVLNLESNYPGMGGLAWIMDVDFAHIDAFEASMRAEGLETFKVHPGAYSQGNFVVAFFEPISINPAVVGLNLAHEKSRHDFAVLARDSGTLTLTGRISLSRGRVSREGYMLLLPTYDLSQPTRNVEQRRRAFRGWVGTTLVGPEFVAGLTPSVGSTLHLSVYDESERPSRLIYNSHSDTGSVPRFRRQHTVEVGGRHWLLVWESMPSLETLSANHEPAMILAGGLIASALLGGLLLLLTQRTERIEQLVQQRTRQLAQSDAALKSSEATFRAAMEHAAIGMALVAPTGRFIKVNAALCALTGHAAHELEQLDFQSITHPDDLQADLAYVAETLAGARQSYQIEKRYFHKDGRAIWVLLSVSLVRDADGSPRYFIAQIQDITQRKAMDRMKNEFVSTVSHELRTPLTSIRGSLGLLSSGAIAAIPPKAAALVQIAHKNSERLVRIINDILDIEKIESGKLEIAPRIVDINELVRQSLDSNEAFAVKFNVKFKLVSWSTALPLLADPDRLMQVMANLISNAAKFSPSGAEVVVRTLQAGSIIRVEVEDQGVGISEEFRSRVFEKFAQADSSSSRNFEGTGLGLSITRALIQAMGGTIGFDSTVGKGTTFYFEFPAVATRPIAAPADPMLMPPETADAHLSLPPYRVLHVEDDPDLSAVIEAAMRGKAQLVTAPTLQVARDLLRRMEFAVVVLDVALPDGNGLTLLDEIKSARSPSPHVMILSSSELTHDVQRKFAAALVKTRDSDSHVVETIFRLIHQYAGNRPASAAAAASDR